MNVALNPEESTAVRKALRSYLSDLQMEISGTDNAAYRRELRDERSALESAVGKLDGTPGGDPSSVAAAPSVRIVELWWSTG